MLRADVMATRVASSMMGVLHYKEYSTMYSYTWIILLYHSHSNVSLRSLNFIFKHSNFVLYEELHNHIVGPLFTS